MHPTEYARWLDELTARVSDRPDVIGLVALGSTAGTDRSPDEWSDHDVFVITVEGGAAALRSDLGWLPDSDRVAFVHRETEHGRALVLDDGHLVELAVFDDLELELASANSYRVLHDRADVTPRMAAIAARTRDSVAARDRDGAHRFGTFVVQLVTGLTRHARGEQLSAHHRLRCLATTALVDLLVSFVPSPVESELGDRLDPHRRFELTHPDLAAEIEAAMRSPLPLAADRLIAIAEAQLVGRVPTATREVFDAVRSVRARLP